MQGSRAPVVNVFPALFLGLGGTECAESSRQRSDSSIRLKVFQIMQQPLRDASLAVLSACQTAMGDENLPDEVIHLGATLLFAGFRGVVATMW